MDLLYPLDPLCLSCDVDPAPSVVSSNCYISVNHLYRKGNHVSVQEGVGPNVKGGGHLGPVRVVQYTTD